MKLQQEREQQKLKKKKQSKTTRKKEKGPGRGGGTISIRRKTKLTIITNHSYPQRNNMRVHIHETKRIEKSIRKFRRNSQNRYKMVTPPKIKQYQKVTKITSYLVQLKKAHTNTW